MLRLCCPLPSLFPNLKHLSWFDEDPVLFTLIATFLPETIQAIGIIPGPSIAHQSLLPILGIKYPDLKEVYLRNPGRGPFQSIVLKGISALLSNLDKLESAVIFNVNATMLEQLARLPLLKCLVIDDVLGLDTFFASPSLKPRFPSLGILHLWATTPKIATVIVNAIEHCRLTDLEIAFETSYPTRDDTYRLYTAVAAQCSPTVLRCLSVDDIVGYSEDMPDDDEFNNYVVGAGTLQILFPFVNLTKIILRTFHGFDLDDTTVSNMAQAWCQVEELRISSSSDPHIPSFRPRTTLIGIRALAVNCLKLKTLDLLFDATNVPPLDPSLPQTALVDLNVFCSPISSPTAVANFISTLFLNLTFFRSECDVDESGVVVRRWENVQTLLKQESPMIAILSESVLVGHEPEEFSDDGESTDEGVYADGENSTDDREYGSDNESVYIALAVVFATTVTSIVAVVVVAFTVPAVMAVVVVTATIPSVVAVVVVSSAIPSIPPPVVVPPVPSPFPVIVSATIPAVVALPTPIAVIVSASVPSIVTSIMPVDILVAPLPPPYPPSWPPSWSLPPRRGSIENPSSYLWGHLPRMQPLPKMNEMQGSFCAGKRVGFHRFAEADQANTYAVVAILADISGFELDLIEYGR
ncbi:hypothetical protein DFH09DRAFT_1324340 [Mycena vulgaris]|nr:hypothetical protein DFH09DRAFT_1324340 [Mycena vulgaris]